MAAPQPGRGPVMTICAMSKERGGDKINGIGKIALYMLKVKSILGEAREFSWRRGPNTYSAAASTAASGIAQAADGGHSRSRMKGTQEPHCGAQPWERNTAAGEVAPCARAA